MTPFSRATLAWALSLGLVSTPCSAAPVEGAESRLRLTGEAFAVGERSVTLVDPSRPTDPHNGEAGAPDRTLETTVWYPAQHRALERLRPGPAPAAEGAFPLVVYSHGFSSMRSEANYLGPYLAARGYVVVAADFPLTSYWTDGGPHLADVVHQPGDVSFLITTALGWNAGGDDRMATLLAGHIDPARVAAVGLSLGGLTTTLVSLHPKLQDPRIVAAVSIAGPSFMFKAPFWAGDDTPWMMIAGDIDALIPWKHNVEPLLTAAPKTTLVTLSGANHIGFAYWAKVLFALNHNADDRACAVVGKRLPADMNFAEQFGDASQGIEPGERNDFCVEKDLPRALRPRHQLALTALATHAFLEQQLAADPAVRERSRAFLRQIFPMENSGVSVVLPREGGL